MAVAIEVRVIQAKAASFTLEATEDAWWIVVARGSQDLSPVWPGRTPWAMTAPVYFDRDGDGWDPPMGEFVFE